MAERRSGLGRGLGALIPAGTGRNLEYISLGDIQPNLRQPRTDFDRESLDSLTESIRRVGVLQPVVLRPQGDGYALVAGERRWRAAQAAGLEEIPALIRETDEQGSLTEALVENLQREDLGPLEEAAAFAQLQGDFGMTHAEIGERVGRSRAAITNSLRLLQLSPVIQAALVTGDLTAGHARVLLSVEDPAEAEDMAERAIAGDWSVRRLEAEIAARKESGHPLTREMRPAAVIELENRLADQLGTKVRIRYKNNKGQVTLSFSSLDQLETIYRRFFT